MSEFFKDTFKRFKPKKVFGDGHGALVVSTKLGTCVVTDSRGNKVKYTCVEKEFVDKHTFDKAVKGFQYLSTKTGIKDYFPEVYHIGREDNTIRMAYFACQTLEHYCMSIDIFDETNERTLNGLFLSINDMLNTLIYNDIVHGDLHSGNILVCLSKYKPMVNLKVIDVDEAGPIKNPVEWDEETKTFKEKDEKGQVSDKYDDAAKLGLTIRSDFVIGSIRRMREAAGHKNKKARIHVDERKEWEARVENRLHQFSNLGKLCMKGSDFAE